MEVKTFQSQPSLFEGLEEIWSAFCSLVECDGGCSPANMRAWLDIHDVPVDLRRDWVALIEHCASSRKKWIATNKKSE